MLLYVNLWKPRDLSSLEILYIRSLRASQNSVAEYLACNLVALKCFLNSSTPFSVVSFLGDVKTELFKKPTAFVFWLLLVVLVGVRHSSKQQVL